MRQSVAGIVRSCCLVRVCTVETNMWPWLPTETDGSELEVLLINSASQEAAKAELRAAEAEDGTYLVTCTSVWARSGTFPGLQFPMLAPAQCGRKGRRRSGRC